MFVFAIEVVVALFILWFMVMQIIVPTMNNLPLFPMFNGSKVDDIVDLERSMNQTDVEKELLDNLSNKKKGKYASKRN